MPDPKIDVAELRGAVERLNAWAAIQTWAPDDQGKLWMEQHVVDQHSADLRSILAALASRVPLTAEMARAHSDLYTDMKARAQASEARVAELTAEVARLTVRAGDKTIERAQQHQRAEEALALVARLRGALEKIANGQFGIPAPMSEGSTYILTGDEYRQCNAIARQALQGE
jgi:hypothetical protein